LAPVAVLAGVAALVAAAVLWPGEAPPASNSQAVAAAPATAGAALPAWSSSAIAEAVGEDGQARVVRAWSEFGEVSPPAAGAALGAAPGEPWFADAAGEQLPRPLPDLALYPFADDQGGVALRLKAGQEQAAYEGGVFGLVFTGQGCAGGEQGLRALLGEDSVQFAGPEGEVLKLYLEDGELKVADAAGAELEPGQWCLAESLYDAAFFDAAGQAEAPDASQAGIWLVGVADGAVEAAAAGAPQAMVGFGAVRLDGVMVQLSLVRGQAHSVLYATAATDDAAAGRAALERLELTAAGEWADPAAAAGLPSPASALAAFEAAFGQGMPGPAPSQDPSPAEDPSPIESVGPVPTESVSPRPTESVSPTAPQSSATP
jgi:hypothetical protein